MAHSLAAPVWRQAPTCLRSVVAAFLFTALLVAGCEPPSAPSPAESREKPLPARVVRDLERATELHDQGKTLEAIQILEAAMRDHGQSFELLDAISVCYLQEDQQIRARETASAALKQKPEALRPLTTLGVSAFDMGSFQEAERYLKRAIVIEPKAGVLAVLGQVYLRLGRHDEAADCFRRSLELNPEQAACHYDLGLVAMRRGKLAEAEQSFQRAYEMNPQDSRAVFNLGNVLRRAGRDREAEQVLEEYRRRQELAARIQAFQAAAKARPRDIKTLSALAEAQIEAHKIERGVGTYMRILDIDPTHKKTLGTLVAMAIQLGYLEAAVGVVERAATVLPDDPEIKALRLRLEQARKKTSRP